MKKETMIKVAQLVIGLVIVICGICLVISAGLDS